MLRDWVNVFHLCDLKCGRAISNSQGTTASHLIANGKSCVICEQDHLDRVGILRVALGTECQLISGSTQRTFHGLDPCKYAEFDPTGRMILAFFVDGFAIIEAKMRSVLKIVRCSGIGESAIAFDSANSFYWSTDFGTLRFPYHWTKNGTTLEVYQPVRMHVPYGKMNIGLSQDGRTLGAGVWNGFGTQQFSGAWIKTADEPAARRVRSGISGRGCSISPNGKFFAMSFVGNGTAIYQTDSNCQQIAIYPTENSVPQFSVDGQWLLVGSRRLSVES